MQKRLAPKAPLYHKTLFLDGLGRAGKFLLGKIVSNFKEVEYFQYSPILEHIPLLHFMGMLETQSAMSLMQIHHDLSIYDRSLGRNLNLRQNDASCVLNSTEYELYRDRMDRPDGPTAMDIYHKEERITSFLVHECLPHFEFFLNSFPQMKMINIQRHPIDMAYSWFKRGWGTRHGQDPYAFIPYLDTPHGIVPWYVTSWQKEHKELSEGARALKYITTLYDLDRTAQSKSKDKTDQLLILSYEEFFHNPNSIIKKIGHFLQKIPYSNMREILAREGCPAPLPLEDRRRKFKELKLSQGVSSSLMNKLAQISQEYEEIWELESSFTDDII